MTPNFECPVCLYRGPFDAVTPATGRREHACCPNCGALERHRLQHLVVEASLRDRPVAQMTMLHFAPEAFFRCRFSPRFRGYETADLERDDVDHQVDVQDLPFADQTFDFVFASHVLEHVADDSAAIREIRRILTPQGIAILPVPIVAEQTIEYGAPNPSESNHVRAPGFDYFERYAPHFSRVETVSSEDLPERHQLSIYEDRTRWPLPECPHRKPMPGVRHRDFVPVCHV